MEAESIDPRAARDRGEFLAFADVEGRLIKAVRLCWRMPGGRWPFASDGPWHLIQREWSDWSAHEEKPVPRLPLARYEIAERDEAVAWLRLIPVDDDRRLVVLAVTQLAKGGQRARVSWKEMAGQFAGLTADTLRMRYSRVMAALTVRVNAAKA
ncbi:hypothetical protein ASF14_14710 [Sphingomonas sp. Leaf257]|nr:hypothetical protein ASF14_14710 [Sphingomonas sp. Leaf257]